MFHNTALLWYRCRQGFLRCIVTLAFVYLGATFLFFLLSSHNETENSFGLDHFFRSRFTFFSRENTTSDGNEKITEKRKDFRIVACAKVTSETPYLLEWIEFHRIQGIDKFVLYHDSPLGDSRAVESAFQLEQLPHLLRTVETIRCIREGRQNAPQCLEDVVDVLPASLLIPDAWTDIQNMNASTWISHRLLQPTLAGHCFERYKDRSEFLVHLDVDEFMYSPTYPTLYDYLSAQLQDEKWKRYIFGRSVGIHVSSINYGSAGQFWDFHNRWFPDTGTGRFHVLFDPRDSSLYRLLNQHSARTLSKMDVVRALQKLRFDRLHDVNFFNMNETLFKRFVEEQLKRDFPNSVVAHTKVQHLTSTEKVRSTRVALLDKIPFWNYTLPSFKPGQPTVKESDNVQNIMQILAESSPQSFQSRTAHNYFSKLIPLNGTTENTNFDGDAARSQRYQRDIRKYAQFYPLLIEEQLFRGFYSALDSDKVNYKSWVATWLPVCKESHSLRSKYLKSQEGFETENAYELSIQLKLLSFLCQGSLPPSITQIGKMVYISETLGRGDISRRYGFLRGCRRPGVHNCAHWIVGGTFIYPKPSNEVRLDHHQFRSYERRTFALPAWRGGPSGYSHSMNYTLLQSYVQTVRDESKLRFVPEIRRRLLDYSLVPSLQQYELQEDFRVVSRNISTHCNPFLLLSDQQIMCPKNKPYVGIDYLFLPPPTPHLPLTWCTDIPRLTNDQRWRKTLVLQKVYPHETAKLLQLAANHTALCAGYGELNCCDYNPDFVIYQSKRFAEEVPLIYSLESKWSDGFLIKP